MKNQMKTSMKYQVSCDYGNLICSGISSDARSTTLSDTDYWHFSFAVFGICPLVFADSIDSVVQGALSHELYYDKQNFSIKSSRFSDCITITRDCRSVGISRGNLKILFYADVGALSGLPDAIRKEYRRYEVRESKEAKEYDDS